MPLNIKDVLADKTNFTDDLEIPFKDGTVRLGDLRTEFSGATAPLQTQMQTLQQERDAERERAATLEATLRQMQPARKEPSNQDQDFDWMNPSAAHGGTGGSDVTRAPGSEYDFSDAYSRGLLNKIQGLTKAELKRLTDSVSGQQQEYVKALAAQTNLMLRQQAKLDFSDHEDWPEGYTPTRAFKEANDRGFIDRETGLPNIHQLYDQLTAPKRQEKAVEDAVAKAVAKAREEWNAEQSEKTKSRFGVVPGGNRSKPATSGNRPGNQQPRTRDLATTIREMDVSDADVAAAAQLFGGGLR